MHVCIHWGLLPFLCGKYILFYSKQKAGVDKGANQTKVKPFNFQEVDIYFK